jgi:hypothetical protein
VRPGPPRGPKRETKMSPNPDTRGRGLSHTRERGLLIPRTDHPMPVEPPEAVGEDHRKKAIGVTLRTFASRCSVTAVGFRCPASRALTYER